MNAEITKPLGKKELVGLTKNPLIPRFFPAMHTFTSFFVLIQKSASGCSFSLLLNFRFTHRVLTPRGLNKSSASRHYFFELIERINHSGILYKECVGFFKHPSLHVSQFRSNGLS